LGEWFVLKVVGVAVQEVEHEVHEDAVLSSTFDQPLEAGVTAVVEGDDLTHVMLEGGDCLGDGWESFGEVPMVPAIELDAGLVPFRDGPEPVPLNLKQPTIPIELGRDEARHHRGNHAPTCRRIPPFCLSSVAKVLNTSTTSASSIQR